MAKELIFMLFWVYTKKYVRNTQEFSFFWGMGEQFFSIYPNKVYEDGTEFWSARKLATALEYTQWRNFQKVIQRAMLACENSGHTVNNDFAEVSKIVEMAF